MGQGQNTGFSYLKKVFYFTHVMGLAASVLFPFVASPIIGTVAFEPSFILLAILFGYSVAVVSYFFIRATLKNQLRNQLQLLEPLTGKLDVGHESLESLNETMEAGVSQVQELVESVMTTSDQLIPYFRSLAQSTMFLADRAKDGLTAAAGTRNDVLTMETKQQDVIALMSSLSQRSQDESALSRQLAQSLEEMARATDHSTAKFIETTTAVEQMTASVREVANQSEDIARSVEDTAQQMDAFGDSFDRIRKGSAAGNDAVLKVKLDAEEGLQVMTRSNEEFDLIARQDLQARVKPGST